MSSFAGNVSTSSGTYSENDYDEQIMVLQLNGVLDFEAIKKAAQIGAIRVRNSNTDAPLVQVGSSLYSAEWIQTLGTDLILSVNESIDGDGSARNVNSVDKFPQQLDLIAASDTRLDANKVLLATDNGCTQNTEQNQCKNGNVDREKKT